MKKQIDLNSDMGEAFGAWTIGDGIEDELMPLISSANVATGFHAGDPNTMLKMLKQAKHYGVGVGAHPGFRDLVGFGRRHINAPADELVNDILYQLGALRELACLAGVKLQHIKPHGALYMHAAKDEELSRALLKALRVVAPDLYLLCMEPSITYRVAKEMGQPVIREFFADRDYDASGSIVFKRRVNALDPQTVAQKVLRVCTEGVVRTVDGQDIPMDVDSVCIHSDTPGALALAQATRELLISHQIRISGFGELPTTSA